MDWDGGRPDPTITDCTPVLPPAILIMQRNLGTGDLTNPTFKEIASGIPSGTLGCTTGIAMSPLGNTLFVGAWVFLDSAQSTCCPEKLLVSFDVVQSTQDGQLLLENQRSVTELQMMTERFPSLSWRDDLGNVSLPSNDGTNSMATLTLITHLRLFLVASSLSCSVSVFFLFLFIFKEKININRWNRHLFHHDHHP
jgi:hypothetical protein